MGFFGPHSGFGAKKGPLLGPLGPLGFTGARSCSTTKPLCFEDAVDDDANAYSVLGQRLVSIPGDAAGGDAQRMDTAAIPTRSGLQPVGSWDVNTSDRHGNKRADNPLPSLWRVLKAPACVASSFGVQARAMEDTFNLPVLELEACDRLLIPKRPHQAPPPTRPIVSASVLA
ncbi:hypothetical protein SPBR_04461 [Sporothrix brasiliensis 5110]|uniref:Uncharacterized protein n=1 Tax=Sporothrix brasiliensis 5110 TaxID=1398154 RepID=A0A0C2F362_9PEZI|nr:uncharacterized protein SPBR_04461 [Sporothrix brasiliensis 5110]KIH93319.1 hypothetical protein SPBR_04461 [Sporothrix brasiliensis 5110]